MPDIAIDAGVDYFAEPDRQPRPYVRFELRTKEVKDAAGNPELIDVAWALITPAGSKDTLEKPVVDWLRDLKLHAESGRIPRIWPKQYAEAFEEWKKGNELPLHGYPIKLWAAVTPAQRQNILNANIFTVQDLALANDEAKGRIGMGANTLVDMAKTWVEDSQGAGALASRLEAAVVGRKEAEDRVKTLEDHIKLLESLVPADKVPPRPAKPSGSVNIA